MISINQQKRIAALRLPKFRAKYGLFIVEGHKISVEILQRYPQAVEHIFATADWLIANADILPDLRGKIDEATPDELKKHSSFSTASPLLLLVRIPTFTIDNDLIPNSLSLVLQTIQDPGNMGTILRIADWFGVAQVFCSADCCDVFSPKVVQASMGSCMRMATHTVDLPQFLAEYPKLPIYGTVLHGSSIYAADLQPRGFVLMGNESQGLSPDLQTLLTHRLTIPAVGAAESLNVAVAAGIVLSHFRKNG